MKRIVQLLTAAFVLAISNSPTLSFTLTTGLYASISEAVSAYRLNPNLTAPRSAGFIISRFDRPMIQTFGKVWRRVGNGSSSTESVVLILKMVDGGYSARALALTNEHKQFTFRWHPATVAVVHTHPNGSDPKPQYDDICVANKYQVPIFTITSRGMYVYDPGSKKITQVMNNLAWLDQSNWNKGLFARNSAK